MRAANRWYAPGTADDGGASAVEYGLMVAGITTVIVAIVFSFGIMVDDIFGRAQSCIASQGANQASYPDCPETP